MDKPVRAGDAPILKTMEPGEYYWCACGKSANQPFCDGSHKGTSISPMPIKIATKQDVFWCTCKQSKNKPFCDGSHK